jgi:hypothetical protein
MAPKKILINFSAMFKKFKKYCFRGWKIAAEDRKLLQRHENAAEDR